MSDTPCTHYFLWMISNLIYLYSIYNIIVLSIYCSAKLSLTFFVASSILIPTFVTNLFSTLLFWNFYRILRVYWQVMGEEVAKD